MGPPEFYSAFGQKARDLLFKDYCFDKKISLIAPGALAGVVTTSTPSFAKIGELYVLDVNTKLKIKHITAHLKVDLDSYLFTTYPDRELSSGTLELDYLNDYAAINGNIGLKVNPDVNLSIAMGTNALAFGTDLGFSTRLWELTKADVGMSFVKDNLVGALTFSLGDNALNASFYHVVDPSTNTGVGVDLSHNLSAQVNEFTVGLQHSLDPFTTVKARITNSGKASALLQLVPVQYKWLPRSLLNISGEVDTKNIRNSARVGLSLVLH